jgi:hypothetical protein
MSIRVNCPICEVKGNKVNVVRGEETIGLSCAPQDGNILTAKPFLSGLQANTS